jgi:hypothetical protein
LTPAAAGGGGVVVVVVVVEVTPGTCGAGATCGTGMWTYKVLYFIFIYVNIF